ncbi:SpoIIE family protein phosphatase [Streptomyces sp. NPDC127097]|uniref:SpoIIE family protein phosphatase n=1 Tax=Streptomyces sp. NPDC127097 TaxID=3347136 RepID=UPI0036599194
MDTPGAAGSSSGPLDEAHPALAMVDAAGVIVGWNAGAHRFLGYPASEVLGQPAASLAVGPLPEAVLSQLSTQQGWSGNVVLRHRDGRRLESELQAFALSQHEGGDAQWFLVAAHADSARSCDGALMHWAFDQSPFALAIYDTEGRLLRANVRMAGLIRAPEEEIRGRRLTDFLEGPAYEAAQRYIDQVGATGEARTLESYARVPGEERPHAWRVDIAPLKDADGPVRGVNVAVADVTHQFLARERLALLDEASRHIGSSLDVGRTCQELADVAVPRFADAIGVDLFDVVFRGDEPEAGPFADRVVLRRAAQRQAAGISAGAVVEIGESHSYPEVSPPAQCLSTGRAALHHPADADVACWLATDPLRATWAKEHGLHSFLTVPVRARGSTLGVVHFSRCALSPELFIDDDLLIAEELVARAAVCIDNARRYTRERIIAVTLQRRLLPRGLPAQDALEVAYRYLPAKTGVSGDWFDVIPLPGARVALVVGDVVGHGLHAAATMGRLRTAVHNFCALDLVPDELLAHLDELVTHIDADAAAEDDGHSVTGATCLYAIYDPVSGSCTVARSGHLGPALVRPDGSVDFPEVPASVPLGLGGGEPFEVAELQVPEGSSLVLFTDGLLKDRTRDIGSGLDLLRETLAGHPERGPEEACRAVMDAVLPARPDDDVALLVARTRLLNPDCVAQWDVPSDPAAVAPVRARCLRQLEIWGLEETAFATELILSELVTNAIRYGIAPITVRLLYDRRLICEIADGSSTSPHLRRAAATDEGGRGLFLVAHLAERWGTRYLPRGKVIWAEQALHEGEKQPGEDLADIMLEQ